MQLQKLNNNKMRVQELTWYTMAEQKPEENYKVIVRWGDADDNLIDYGTVTDNETVVSPSLDLDFKEIIEWARM